MENLNNKTDELQQQLTEAIDTMESTNEEMDEALSQLSLDDIQNEFTLYMELLEAEEIERTTQLFSKILTEYEKSVEHKSAA